MSTTAASSAAPHPLPATTNARGPRKIRTAFTHQLNGLINTLVELLDGNDEVLRAEVAVRDFSAVFPTRIIEDWGRLVVPICGPQLLAKDFDYFMELDVPGTVRRLQDEGVIDAKMDTSGLEKIVESSIRAPIRALAPADRAQCMDALAVLTSLAVAYQAAINAAPATTAPTTEASTTSTSSTTGGTKRKATGAAADAATNNDAKKDGGLDAKKHRVVVA